MGKKKHKKQKDLFNVNKENIDIFTSKLDKQYREIIGDIEDIQYRIYEADRKKQKKQKKKMKQGKIDFYEPKSKKVRIWAANELTGDRIFSVIKNILEDIKPIAIIISKLIMTLIVSILSLDIVKEKISTVTLNRMNSLYNLCAAVK